MWLHKAAVRNVTRALKEVRAFEWEGDYRPATRVAIKKVTELTLTNEIDEFVARPRYQRAGRQRVIYRNGGYLRRLLTELGDVVIKVAALKRGFRFRALQGASGWGRINRYNFLFLFHQSSPFSRVWQPGKLVPLLSYPGAGPDTFSILGHHLLGQHQQILDRFIRYLIISISPLPLGRNISTPFKTSQMVGNPTLR